MSSRSLAPRAQQRFDLADLNQEQRAAVLHEEGPLLVLAGAGSGKTRVITYRVARLLRDGIPPEQVLGLTFTNKAAREMRERLRCLCGSDAGRVQLSTFHSLGLSILKEEHEAAGLSASFSIYDTSDQLSLVREMMRQVKVADRRLDATRVLDIILKTKRRRLPEVEIDWGDDYELAAYDLYPRYVEQMKAFCAIDFDDLILRTQDLLQLPDVRERWRRRYAYLLVDEYQDTSPDQLDLVRVLAGERRNVCVVGDDDQSIYAWRGAAADNILLFSKHFAGAREIVLDENYRSTGNILAAANAVIKHNAVRKSKSLWCNAGLGHPVEVVACANEDDEAAFVAGEVGKLVYDGVRYEDIAVLYRSNVQSQVFEETFAAERLPFRVVGGQAFFDRKEVRDALAYLAVAHNPHDQLALRRIINSPPRGIGPASLERLNKHGEEAKRGLFWALTQARQIHDLPKAALSGIDGFLAVMQPAVNEARRLSAAELPRWAERLFSALGLRDAVLAADDAPTLAARRLANLEQVIKSLARYAEGEPNAERPLAGFLRAASLVSSPEEDAELQKGQLTLMTLHSAKGLEFPFVFLVGMEEDLLPHKRSLELGGELAEERRLCYVGITRARRSLWLTWARTRRKHGKPSDRSPSRFLDELPLGEGVLRRDSVASTQTEAEADAAAQAFFQRMRAQLGIEDA